MLVLSRRTTEKIAIGYNITVKILAIEGDRVKVGIDAPISIPVWRTEIQPFLRLPPMDDLCDG